MIREDKFLISRRPYAVDLSSLRIAKPWEPRCWVLIDAVWFRRRRGVTVAVVGTLYDFQATPAPLSAVEALGRYTDGRYGGAWTARWDGESYVSEHPSSPEDMAEHMALLRPMLERYPEIPPGYDGWWRF